MSKQKYDVTSEVDGHKEVDTIESSSLSAAKAQAEEAAKEFNDMIGEDAVKIDDVEPHHGK